MTIIRKLKDGEKPPLDASGSRYVVHADDGDLMIIPDGTGFLLGLFDQSANSVVWGDSCRLLGPWAGAVIAKEEMTPAAGKFIGRRFASLAEARDVLTPFRVVR